MTQAVLQSPTYPTRSRVRTRRAPLLPVAAALCTGVWAGEGLDLPVLAWVVAGAAALAAAMACWRRAGWEGIRLGGLLLAVVAIGAVHVILAGRYVADDHVVTFTGSEQSLATVRGRIVTGPQVYRADAGERLGYVAPPQTGFIVAVSEILTDEGFRPASGLAQVTIRHPRRDLQAGHHVELVGWIGRYPPPQNPGEYDARRTAARRGVLVWVSVPAEQGAIARDDQQGPLSRALWNVRSAARQHLATAGEEHSGRVLAALVIGERHPALRAMSRAMARAGVAHLLSISGLHLGIFLGCVHLLSRVVLSNPRRAAVLVLVVLAAYILLAEPRAPLLRSAVMAATLCLGVLTGRPYSTANALAAAAIILLAIDPLQLFDPGFQLTFGIVAGIGLLHEPVRRLLFGRFIERRGLMVFRRDEPVRRWLLERGANALMSTISAAIAAYISAAPLVAYHFGIFSPYAVVLSILLLPLVVGVLVPGYLSLALAWPMPNLSWQLGRAADRAAGALSAVVESLERLPGLSLSLRPVPAVWVLLAWAAILLLAYVRRVPRGRWLAGATTVALIAVTAWTQTPARAPEAMQLDLLAVGAGQCALLRLPSGQTVLFDAGTQSRLDVHDRTLQPFLRDRRLPPPRIAFVSHPDSNQYNALPPLARLGILQTVYLGDTFSRDDRPDSGRFLEELARSRVSLHALTAGQAVDLDDRTRVEVLWPPPDRWDLSSNDSSLVLRVVCDTRRILLPGDIEQAALEELLASGQDLSAEVLVLPQHGGWAPALPAFVEAVNPQVVLVRGLRCPAGPTQEARDFYRRLPMSRRVHCAAQRGWIHVTFPPGQVNVRTMH